MTGSIGDNGQLRSFIERIEHVDIGIKDLQDDRKDILTEAKSNGFDPAIIRKVVALRKMDPQKRIEAQMILDTYLEAVGFDTTPLAIAARGEG